MNLALVLQHRAVAAIQHWFGAGTSAGSARSMHLPQRIQKHAKPAQQRPLAVAIPDSALQPPVSATRVAMPLRVLRVIESGQSRASTGRMVISGRMADVCAELDRLVAREASLQ